MLQNENEAWQLFEILSENFLYHTSATNTPMYGSNRGRIYEVENSIDIHSNVDELSQKIDRLLIVGLSPLSLQDVCVIGSGPTHLLSECPAVL